MASPTSAASRGRAGPVRGELRAQVGAPLGGIAHLRGQLVQELVVDTRRRDHDALLVERRRVGRHAARRAAADVGVVRAVGGEARRSSSLANTGEISVMSGRWVPPR